MSFKTIKLGGLWYIVFDKGWNSKNDAVDMINELRRALTTHEDTPYLTKEDLEKSSNPEELKKSTDYYESVSRDMKYVVKRRLAELKKEVEDEERSMMGFITNNPQIITKPKKKTPYKDIIISELEHLLKEDGNGL